jgi:ADP-heptose:LPS heptosyltransferase
MRHARKVLLSSGLWISAAVPALLVGIVARLARKRMLRPVGKLDRVRTVLISRFDGIGDLLLTAGLAADLKRGFPGAKVMAVVSNECVEFARVLDGFDEVIGYRYLARSPLFVATTAPRALGFCRKHLWNRQIDLAINPRWGSDNRGFAPLGYLSLCRSHLGYDAHRNSNGDFLNPGYNCLYSDLIPDDGLAKHEIERHRDVIRYLGFEPSDQAPRIRVSASAHRWAQEEAKVVRPFMILGIGSSTPRRTWPPERFAITAAAFPEYGCVVLGGKSDSDAAERVLRPVLGDRLKNYAGLCTLERSAAMASLADLYVGNNSAPMHLAASFGVPVVDICCHPDGAADTEDQSPIRYAATYTRHVVVNPERPLGPACAHGCLAGTAHCILGVSTEEAIAATRWLLRGQVRDRRTWYPLTLWRQVQAASQPLESPCPTRS